MSSNCIEIKELNYRNIFHDFSITLESEKFLTISGANNCGKTTLIRIIDGQIPIYNTIILNNQKYEEYKINEIGNIIKTIIPLEITFVQHTVEDELSYQLPLNVDKETKQKKIKNIAKKFKLTKFLTKSVENIPANIIIRLQIALALITNPQIIVIDDLSQFFTKKELHEITLILKSINIEEKTTIIMITSDLNCNLQSDYTYIINNGEIVIEGTPLEVLEKDNILNKAGLNLPFMIDLSVKLRDYDLIENIELDMESLVDILWN